MRLVLAAVLLALVAAPAAQALPPRLDYDFARGQGYKQFLMGGGDNYASSVIRTRSGKLVMAGYSGQNRMGVARLHPSGRFDRRFSGDGRKRIAVEDINWVVDLAELADGGVLAGVDLTNHHGDTGKVAVVRLRRNGTVRRTTRVPLPGAPASVTLNGMVKLSGGGVALVSSVRVEDRPMVAVSTLDPAGRIVGEPILHDLGGMRAYGATRLRGGGLVIAVSGERDGALVGLTEDGTLIPGRRRDFPDVLVEGVERDGTGVAALLDAGRRWGVRRFTRSLRPRRAPRRLTTPGEPHAFAMDRRGRAWLGFSHGRIGRVRADGRPDRRFGPNGIAGRFAERDSLSSDDVVAHPRRGAFLVGRAHEERDIREDYGPSGMWIGRFF